MPAGPTPTLRKDAGQKPFYYTPYLGHAQASLPLRAATMHPFPPKCGPPAPPARLTAHDHARHRHRLVLAHAHCSAEREGACRGSQSRLPPGQYPQRERQTAGRRAAGAKAVQGSVLPEAARKGGVQSVPNPHKAGAAGAARGSPVRPMACFSNEAFRQGSMRYTWLALVRVMPAPPALRPVHSASRWQWHLALSRQRLALAPAVLD